MTPNLTRRQLLAAAGGTVGVAVLGACTTSSSTVSASSDAVRSVEAARRARGRELVTARLVPRRVEVDLGGITVPTWAYGGSIPGPLVRATAGDRLRIDVDNQLPADTSVHWHGIALRNDMDGVPGLTQQGIRPGQKFRYEFTVPDPGTYFYHPHVGVQLDRGLYGVLLVDDPREPGGYDAEWTVVLDDWVDGTGRTPDEVLARLTRPPGGTDDMGGMDMGGMDMGGSGSATNSAASGGMGGMGESMTSPLLGGAGDVAYPHYLVNGRIAGAPETFTGQPGQRLRLRLINAGSDTAFRVALAGHRMTVTHSDGFPVIPITTDALLIGMGERFDVEVTLADGAFPLVAVAEGKDGAARGIIRTGTGSLPDESFRPPELNRKVLLGYDLTAAESVRLRPAVTDRSHNVELGGSMAGYTWTINGRQFSDSTPLPVRHGERVRLRFINRTMMFHPMHVHGHTFAVTGGGPRKDTVIVRPMQRLDVDFDADNPGQWATHCHNIYHAERGMMVTLSYQK